MLTTTRRIHRPAVACALACALFASAISSATARPLQPTATPAAASSPSSETRLHQPGAGVTLPECERQVLASRGIAAPATAAAGALAQERYSSYGEPEPMTSAQSPEPSDDTPWLPIALAIAVALAIVAASATLARPLRIRRRAAQATT